jgi:primosomal protein N' (replication factor Y)
MWRVAPVSAPYLTLTYSEATFMAEGLAPGMRVLVPMGRSLRMGVLLERLSERPADLPEDVKLKDVLWPLEHAPLLSSEYLELVADLAARGMAEPGRVLEVLLPSGLRDLSAVYEVFDTDFPKSLRPKQLAAYSEDKKAILWRHFQEGRMRVKPRRAGERQADHVSIAKDPPWPVRPAAKRRLEVLEYVHEQGTVLKSTLLHDLGKSAAPIVRTLAEMGLVKVGPSPVACEVGEICRGDEETFPSLDALTLTDEQSAALSDMLPLLDGGGVRLVHGVTGSGKTVLYMHLVREAVAKGRSVLLLAPDVALTLALAKAVAKFLPASALRLYHGSLPAARREEIYKESADTEPPLVVVGTRSALFLPLKNIGLIVMDEEHDESYKQEERLAYQAKEVAFSRAKRQDALLVLGSATPDVKTYHAAEAGQVGMSVLSKRVGEGGVPEIEIVDAAAVPRDGPPLAPPVVEALRETVERGDQAVVMLNRRGFSPLMYCLECKETAGCPHCAVSLTYHKGRERLLCHYCGHSEAFPTTCRGCGSSNFLPMGGGTESVEEMLPDLLPEGTDILRLDRDSTRRPGVLEEVLDDFAAGKAQVLVGTQMLSKGHHFPDVTLAVAADADLGLNLPDYRAAERSFQLLLQVAGRSGRGDKPGKVLIQTRNPNHYCWNFVKAGDFKGFYEMETARRKRFGYPPYGKLALVRVSWPTAFDDGGQLLKMRSSELIKSAAAKGVRLMGPAPSPISRLKGRIRLQYMLKASDWPSIRAVYYDMHKTFKDVKHIRISLDLDPVNML